MTANTSGVGVPLLASVPPMKHSPNSELTRLHAILSVGNGSIHPDAEAMIVRGAIKIKIQCLYSIRIDYSVIASNLLGERPVSVVVRPASLVVVIVAKLRA